MQKLYSKIKISLGNDEFLVVKRESYGNLLISLINAKLPEDFRLHLGRILMNFLIYQKQMLKLRSVYQQLITLNFTSRAVENHCRKFLLHRLYLIIAITIIRVISNKKRYPLYPFCKFNNHPPLKCIVVANIDHGKMY